MSSIFFKKVKSKTGQEYLVVFEAGKLQKPLFMLDEYDIEDLNEAWK